MSVVVNRIEIAGTLNRVFDFVTTAKYWPQWHPATIAVSGAVDSPVTLGDVIRERARIGGGVGENDWTVVEHERPRRVVLWMPGTRLGDLQITYLFEPSGAQVEFTRELQFDLSNLPATIDRNAVERQMSSDSAEGLRRLRVLVERKLKS
jgi:hypothetical protein